ncbi:MAG: hypothetical protein HY909_15695 [Deltaproteobacteria bacterium]|nr:hypothetical protein [Deltaproteobacteria bacterium]
MKTTEGMRLDPARVSAALGSSRVVPVRGTPSRGPLDLLALRAEVERRLRSSGGRPTDPDWTMSRIVRFQPARWEDLEQLAGTLSQEGRSVSPSQLAAMLVERGLAELSLVPAPGASAPGATRAVEPPTALLGDEYFNGLRSIAQCLDVEG